MPKISKAVKKAHRESLDKRFAVAMKPHPLLAVYGRVAKPEAKRR